jgi:hypothetical protein
MWACTIIASGDAKLIGWTGEGAEIQGYWFDLGHALVQMTQCTLLARLIQAEIETVREGVEVTSRRDQLLCSMIESTGECDLFTLANMKGFLNEWVQTALLEGKITRLPTAHFLIAGYTETFRRALRTQRDCARLIWKDLLPLRQISLKKGKQLLYDEGRVFRDIPTVAAFVFFSNVAEVSLGSVIYSYCTYLMYIGGEPADHELLLNLLREHATACGLEDAGFRGTINVVLQRAPGFVYQNDNVLSQLVEWLG